jgi:AcrR family transcriptional regulator
VNKQLISHYFGGKQGLTQALRQEWERQESAFADPAKPLAALASDYLHAALASPQRTRLLMWEGLRSATKGDAGSDVPVSPEVADLARRQKAGELAPNLDPRFVLLLLFAAVAAPVVMPQMVRRICDLDPQSPEFEAEYSRQLGLILERLAGDRTGVDYGRRLKPFQATLGRRDADQS